MQTGQSFTACAGDAPLYKPAVDGLVVNAAITELVDVDSEAESFQDGRTEEVDRDTRGRAFTWCQSFLSGAWKTITQEEFEISIVRYGNKEKSSLI